MTSQLMTFIGEDNLNDTCKEYSECALCASPHAPMHQHTHSVYTKSDLLQDCNATAGRVFNPDMTAASMGTCDITHPATVLQAQGTSPMRQHSQSMRRASAAMWVSPQACCRHCSSRAGDSRLTAGTGLSSFPSRLDIRMGCCASSILSAQCCMEHTHGDISCHTHSYGLQRRAYQHIRCPTQAA